MAADPQLVNAAGFLAQSTLRTMLPWLVIGGIAAVLLTLAIAKLEKGLFRLFRKSKKATTMAQNQKCPQCGGNLLERSGKYGPFFGCTNYPKCKFTKDF